MSEAQVSEAGQAAAESADTQVEAKPEAQERTFTQADLNKIAANEKRDGKSARDSELLEKTGAESIDDLLAAYTAQQEISAELEGQEVSELKKSHKEALKGVQAELETHKEALQAILEKQREGLAEHYAPLLDRMSAPEQLAYIAEHGEALRAGDARGPTARPATVGRGSSPGSGAGSSASAARTEITPGLGRLKVAYETRSGP